MKRPILIIEDNFQNRYLITFLLEKSGYTVLAAVDGAEGIELASRMQPEAILLDIQLPTMSGYTVARALRAIRSLETVPIIAVTSYAMSGDREKSFESGCDGYIEKPIDPEKFIATMEQLIKATQRQNNR